MIGALLRRRGRACRRDDSGSALLVALGFLALFGLVVGVLLGYTATGLDSARAAHTVAIRQNAADASAEGAVRALATNVDLGRDNGGPPASQTTACFTLPGGTLDYTDTVTARCTPRAGSGVGGAGSTTQPSQAVFARSSLAAEGVVQPTAGTVRVLGDTTSMTKVGNVTGATLAVTGSIKANATCSGAGTITATGGTSCPASPAVTGTALPGFVAPSAYPTPVTSLPACAPVVAFSPGTYTSASSLNTLMNSTCAGRVFWFQPGTYYFDFTDAGSHEWLISTAGDDVVGGVASGWNPASPTRPTVPFPTTSSGTGVPDQSGCSTTQSGVQFVFGNDSRLRTAAGKVQLCALIPNASSQEVAIYGPSSTVSVPGSVPNDGATTSADQPIQGGRSFSSAANGAAVDGASASIHLPNQGSVASLKVSGFLNQGLPSTATITSVTATVVESSITGTGRTCLFVGTSVPTTDPCLAPGALLLHTCNGSCSGAYTDSVTVGGIATPADLSSLVLSYVVSNFNNQPIDASIDGIALAVSYTAPLRATATYADAYAPSDSSTWALVTTSGAAAATNGFVVHGTIYAPLAALDLSMSNVPYDVVDRGVLVRDAYLGMSSAAAYAGPLISVPLLRVSPRDVVVEAYDTTTSPPLLLLRAEVKLTGGPSAGSVNGLVPTVLFWSHH